MYSSTPFFTALHARVMELGGYFNAHLHLDRAGTLDTSLTLVDSDDRGVESGLSLTAKHSLIPRIHASQCYDLPILINRVHSYLDRMVELGTTHAATLVDTTADRVGLSALEAMLHTRDLYRQKLKLRVGAYSPLGFRDDQPERWSLFQEGAKHADFLGLLPERDDQIRYTRHIGFEEACRRALLLSAQLRKDLHIHVDQLNHPAECAAESVLRIVADLDLEYGFSAEPKIWLVHVISPSAYDEQRFNRLIDCMLGLNVGVICCPSAAISMRQYRFVHSPTHNSIARVLEMIHAGIHVRIGSDNICDITSPAGTPDLMYELFVLCNALRYYDIELLASIAAGHRPKDEELSNLHRHLLKERLEIGG